eukprot:jgi/Botrbrau1/20428/Bobra.0877s0001.1
MGDDSKLWMMRLTMAISKGKLTGACLQVRAYLMGNNVQIGDTLEFWTDENRRLRVSHKKAAAGHPSHNSRPKLQENSNGGADQDTLGNPIGISEDEREALDAGSPCFSVKLSGHDLDELSQDLIDGVLPSHLDPCLATPGQGQLRRSCEDGDHNDDWQFNSEPRSPAPVGAGTAGSAGGPRPKCPEGAKEPRETRREMCSPAATHRRISSRAPPQLLRNQVFQRVTVRASHIAGLWLNKEISSAFFAKEESPPVITKAIIDQHNKRWKGNICRHKGHGGSYLKNTAVYAGQQCAGWRHSLNSV